MALNPEFDNSVIRLRTAINILYGKIYNHSLGASEKTAKEILKAIDDYNKASTTMNEDFSKEIQRINSPDYDPEDMTIFEQGDFVKGSFSDIGFKIGDNDG